jgi:hypothetical protein
MAKRARPSGASPAVQIKELEQNPVLIDLCSQFLPPNYEFEIPKTVWRIQKTKNCSTVALQMPEGERKPRKNLKWTKISLFKTPFEAVVVGWDLGCDAHFCISRNDSFNKYEGT